MGYKWGMYGVVYRRGMKEGLCKFGVCKIGYLR